MADRKDADPDFVDKRYVQYIQRKYHLPHTIALRLANQQECEVCGATPKRGKVARRLYIDHDHATGRVRGVVCIACNQALTAFDRGPEYLEQIRNYLLGASST